ncbi:MAG: hypothetical protein JNN16_14165 [Nitrospira sp.]|nr:hypothetical protein [Nitrospira sp.]
MSGKDRPVEELLGVLEAIINYVGWQKVGGALLGIAAFWWVIKYVTSLLFSRVRVIGIRQKEDSCNAARTNEKYQSYVRKILLLLVVVIASFLIGIMYLQARLETVGATAVMTDIMLGPGEKIIPTINGNRFKGYMQSHRLMHICRANDKKTDPMVDSKIDKSNAFQIVDRDISIQTSLKISYRTIKELDLDEFHCFIWLIPINLSVENVVTQQQIKDQGAIFVGEHGIQTNAFGFKRISQNFS